MDDLDRNQRFSILAQADSDTERILTLAEQVLAEPGAPITLIQPPRVGMMMLRLREPVEGTVFNAGEVLVTEAHLTLGGHQGYAMRLGRAPELTLAAAVLDAAVAASHPLSQTITAELQTLAAAEQARQQAAWQTVAPTQVVFDEMR